MVEGTGRQHMARLIEQMSHDDRVDLMRRLMPRVAESLLRLVDEADRRDIAQLAKYDENTAGAYMTTDYAWLPANISAAEALDRLRLQAPNSETIYYIYILDENRKLLGVLSLRDLILAARHVLIRDIMEQNARARSAPPTTANRSPSCWPSTTCSPFPSSTSRTAWSASSRTTT